MHFMVLPTYIFVATTQKKTNVYFFCLCVCVYVIVPHALPWICNVESLVGRKISWHIKPLFMVYCRHIPCNIHCVVPLYLQPFLLCYFCVSFHIHPVNIDGIVDAKLGTLVTFNEKIKPKQNVCQSLYLKHIYKSYQGI